jgi:hypothetical protein
VPNTSQLIRSSAIAAGPPVCTIDPARELFISDVSVVDDCYRTNWKGKCPGTFTPATRGAWTFGRLAEGIFGTTDPATLSNRVRQWLSLWMSDQVINGDAVEARHGMDALVLGPWQEASGSTTLDMKKAPFRLLAFALRMDIRSGVLDPNITTAGEFHVVYNLLDKKGRPTDFNLVFEYLLEAKTCQQILAIAEGFHNLGSIDFGPSYNANLQAITDRVLTPGAAPSRLNGSALLVVRTNEAFLGRSWEMREFALKAASGQGKRARGKGVAPLLPRFLELTPAERHQGTQTLANYINLAGPDIIQGAQAVPINFQGQPFLAGVAHNHLDLNWDGPAPACSSVTNPLARRLFSTFTCQGCHGPETATTFRHVSPRERGEASELSPYLTGSLVPDICGLNIRFNDILRRRNDFCFLITRVCPAP